jgi:hypothetical protein
MRVYFSAGATGWNREVSFILASPLGRSPIAKYVLKTRVQSPRPRVSAPLRNVLLKLNPTVHPSLRKPKKPYLTHPTDQINQSIDLRFALTRQRIVFAGSDGNFKYYIQFGGNNLRFVTEYFSLSAVATPCLIFSLYDGDDMPISRGKRLQWVRVRIPFGLVII